MGASINSKFKFGKHVNYVYKSRCKAKGIKNKCSFTEFWEKEAFFKPQLVPAIWHGCFIAEPWITKSADHMRDA